MVKLILPNSAPPGQESQKRPENSATDLVTPRKTRAFVTSRSDFVTSRQSKNFSVGHLAHGEKKFAACARWPSPWHYFWDIFGSPGQEGPSWAKWVSPLNSSMKTTTFKPNLYFYHRIPLTICSSIKSFINLAGNFVYIRSIKNLEDAISDLFSRFGSVVRLGKYCKICNFLFLSSI